jgi:hypothetical protein
VSKYNKKDLKKIEVLSSGVVMARVDIYYLCQSALLSIFFNYAPIGQSKG